MGGTGLRDEVRGRYARTARAVTDAVGSVLVVVDEQNSCCAPTAGALTPVAANAPSYGTEAKAWCGESAEVVAGFDAAAVEFTHQVTDGMHGAIIRAVKPEALPA